MVLADYIGEGNVDNFVKLMNEKARKSERIGRDFEQITGGCIVVGIVKSVRICKMSVFATELLCFFIHQLDKVINIADLDNTKIPIKQSVLDVLKNTGSSLANVENHVGKSMTAIDLLYSMMRTRMIRAIITINQKD